MLDCLALTLAGARDDRHGITTDVDRGLDDAVELIRRQREELARPAGNEQGRHVIAFEPTQPIPIALSVELAPGVEIGNGERQ